MRQKTFIFIRYFLRKINFVQLGIIFQLKSGGDTCLVLSLASDGPEKEQEWLTNITFSLIHPKDGRFTRYGRKKTTINCRMESAKTTKLLI